MNCEQLYNYFSRHYNSATLIDKVCRRVIRPFPCPQAIVCADYISHFGKSGLRRATRACRVTPSLYKTGAYGRFVRVLFSSINKR